MEKTFLHLDIKSFEIAETYYYDANITDNLSSLFTPVKIKKSLAEKTELDEEERLKKMTFKAQCLEYNEKRNCGFSISQFYDEIAVRAVNIMGIELLEKMKFHKGDIKKALIGKLEISEKMKIVEILNLKAAEFYTSAKLITMLQEACAFIEIDPIKCSTYIEKLYEVKGGKSMSKTIKGKQVRGYTILGEKAVFGE